jgi:hypothetical protein
LYPFPRFFAQDDEEGNEKIRDKMNEYIQRRLNLNDDEAKNLPGFPALLW